MKKKLAALLLAVMLVASFAACSRGGTPASGSDVSGSGAAADFKIGIITGTVSQGEEEYQAGQKMARLYPDIIVTATYPDNFTAEVEQVISTVMDVVSDESVKAIVFVQAVPGAAASIDRVRETYPDRDILFVCGVVAETEVLPSKADVSMLVDEITMGSAVPEQAHKMGAETFIHYSFARHMSYPTIAARYDIMEETCATLGMAFVPVTAPDPTSDAGVAGAQQFIKEDVPKQVAQYGKDTAFFSTNCAMMEPLIRAVAEEGAIFPQQCCPSPYHGYPAAFGIEVDDAHAGDVDYMLEQIQAKVAEAGNTGRMSTWALPVNMLMVEAGTDYAIRWCRGEFTEKYDAAEFKASIDKVAAEYNTTAKLTEYVGDDGNTVNNFLLISADFVDF